MTKVTIKMDYVASLLVSYHVLNTAADYDREINPNLFDAFTILPSESTEYLAMITPWKILELSNDDQKKGFAKAGGGLATLEDAITTHQSHLSPAVVANLRAFDIKFRDYFAAISAKAEDVMQKAEKVADDSLDRIFSIAKDLTGVTIPKPENIEIRVVEGLSDTAFPDTENVHYYARQQVVESKARFLKMLIHETVGHKTVKHLTHMHHELFGEHNYSVEEGYVKVITERIRSQLGIPKDNTVRYGTINISYNVFDGMFDSPLRTTDFTAWYHKGLVEVKRQMDESGVTP